MTVEKNMTSTVYCDRPGCTSCITVSHDITEEQAAAMAYVVAWQVEFDKDQGRWKHQCPKHEQEGT